MSLIKEALDKAENKEGNETPEKKQATEPRANNEAEQSSVSLIIWSVVIVILAAFVGGQLVLLAWLFLIN
jgi:hypothetical protein